MKRILHLITAVIGGLILLAAPAHAAGPPTESFTIHLEDEASVIEDVHPCTGQPAEITVSDTGVIHLIAKPDGTVHITGTLRGTFSLDLLPADGVPDATGVYVNWFGGNGLLLEEGGVTGKAQTATTLNGSGTNTDGSTFRFHANDNLVFDANGDLKHAVEMAKATCS